MNATITQMCATEQQGNASTVSITPLVFTVNAVRMEHGAMLQHSSVKVHAFFLIRIYFIRISRLKFAQF